MNSTTPDIRLKEWGNKKVLSFGELLLRICPDGKGAWLQQNALPFYVGGAEANVAAALALWGVPVSYLSCVPENVMVRQVVNYLAAKSIDVSKMIFAGNRLGLYFLPKGADLKNAAVIYDRTDSSFSQLKQGTIDWDNVLEDVAWLNFSAISPAINNHIAEICKEAAAAATQKNIVVSLDLNYRAKLWQYGKSPVDVMPQFLPFCTVVMGNIWAAEKMLGIDVDAGKIERNTREAYLQQALQTSKNIVARFPNVKAVANTFRFDRQQDGVYYHATLFGAEGFYHSAGYTVEKVVDNVGSGDCFMAGLIYGFYKKMPLQQSLDFATAAAVKKLSQAGDFTNSSVAAIQNLIAANER